MKEIFGLLFSPESSALTLVLKTIDDAQRSLRLIGNVFTSLDVVKSLIDAKKARC